MEMRLQFGESGELNINHRQAVETVHSDCIISRTVVQALRPKEVTECQHYKGAGLTAATVSYQRRGSSQERDKTFFPSSFQPFQFNLFNFNSALITILFSTHERSEAE